MVALALCRKQQRYVEDLPRARHAVLEISLDETEHNVSIGGDAGIYSMMMMHCKLFWTHLDGTNDVVELICPPVFLVGTTAACIIKAASTRIPLALALLKRKVLALTVLFGSDSARSCKRVGRHYQAHAWDSQCNKLYLFYFMPLQHLSDYINIT
jgi:hypothetical protein